jgi:hypothetical protein
LPPATIANDGTGDDGCGNYDVQLFNGKRRWKSCRVEDFNRKKLLGWDILCRALYMMLGARNGICADPVKNAGQAAGNG